MSNPSDLEITVGQVRKCLAAEAPANADGLPCHACAVRGARFEISEYFMSGNGLVPRFHTARATATDRASIRTVRHDTLLCLFQDCESRRWCQFIPNGPE